MTGRWGWLLLGAIAAGALLRLPQLDGRPMHTDEAVHAVKFGTLLEKGEYRYDPHEYHGPTLNYLTLIPAWLSSQRALADVTETTLRIVPASFGILLLLLFIPVLRAAPGPLAFAALLTACSPAMVYYSRYYIQEMLLVSSAFGMLVAAYRFLCTRARGWAAAAGVFGGLMIASKETWVICSAMMLAAYGGTAALRVHQGTRVPQISRTGILVAGLCAVLTAVAFYSSLFTWWPGLVDAVRAFGTYVGRAGEETRHGHPWSYFLRMLTLPGGGFWTEGPIVLLALAGAWSLVRPSRRAGAKERDLITFFALYALLMVLMISLIPYKTPWLLVGALQPLCILAGFGASELLRRVQERFTGRAALAGARALLALAVGFLAYQSYLTSYRYADDPANPYVYSHPRKDVFALSARVREAAQGGPVQVIAAGGDYWPLPWYLRDLRQVGWWSSVEPGLPLTPVMLVDPDLEGALAERIFAPAEPGTQHLYVPLFDRPLFLRPGKEIRGYAILEVVERLRREP